MEGIDSFGVIAGIVLVIGGLALLVVSIFFWPVFFYGLIVFILGIVILITLKQQEFIEPIKKVNSKKKK